VKENPEKAEQQAQALTEGVQSTEIIPLNKQEPNFSVHDLHSLFSTWQNGCDMVQGGQLGAPKFPMPAGQQFLLHYHSITGNQEALDSVVLTLEKMAEGGIYDQIGGGFARYSVDKNWTVPHFEKMLYDNAQLVSLYSKAYKKTKNLLFKTIVRETLEFVGRELTSGEGAFYSSLDADSEGEEGKFYVWSNEELENVLGHQFKEISDYYNVIPGGNWERGKNILHVSGGDKKPVDLNSIKAELLRVRSQRARPDLDDKILTSWNALMIKGYADAYCVFNEKDYLKKAEKAADFILVKLKSDDGRLDRNYKNGRASINAFLDDYAFTIEAFMALYEATFNEKWLFAAQELSQYVLLHFKNDGNAMFYYTSDLDPKLIARKSEIVDNVISSSNSQMAKNLFILGHYFYNDEYITMAQIMVNNVKDRAVRGSLYFANWGILMGWMATGVYEVSIIGENYENIKRELDEYYLPHIFLSGGKEEGTLEQLKNKLVEGETLIYVCRDKNCLKPVSTVNEALDLLY
ncbi:MAG: thioredoxin domain-containing protein, partial [Spirochaetaceae bacterium]|nr:thioredoxin domain-containing protein [Spirochaetaceae bacterium]